MEVSHFSPLGDHLLCNQLPHNNTIAENVSRLVTPASVQTSLGLGFSFKAQIDCLQMHLQALSVQLID